MTLHPASPLALGALLCAQSAAEPSVTLPPGFSVEPFATGLYLTTSIDWLPDGRMLANEFWTPGDVCTIRLIERDGTVRLEPVYSTLGHYGGGLSGMAVAPDYATSGHVFVWVSLVGNVDHELRRLHIDPATLTVDEETLVFRLQNPTRRLINQHTQTNHQFGPDGRLYLNLGDASVKVSSPEEAAIPQSLDNLWGKVFAVDVNQPYPIDVSSPESLIMSRGHRNQYGLAVHPTVGAVWSTENGGIIADELNHIVAGGNFGWPLVEGFSSSPELIAPARVYLPQPDPEEGQRLPAPVDCTFYTGSLYPPEYRDNLFYGDFNFGGFHRVRLGGESLSEYVSEETWFTGLAFDRPVAVAEGPDGRLYFSSHPEPKYVVDIPNNSILRITFTPTGFSLN